MSLKSKSLPSLFEFKSILPELSAAAQRIYVEWEQDEEGFDEKLGMGGICHLIAAEMADAIRRNFNTPCFTELLNTEQHVVVIALLKDGIYEIDIHHSIYEIGSGFNWKKKKGVMFTESDVSMHKLDDNIDNIRLYVGDDIDEEDFSNKPEEDEDEPREK